MNARELGSTDYPITFFMASSSDHISGATGLTPTTSVSKNGGPFAAPLGVVSEIGYGWYALAGNALDRNTLGELLVHAEAATADDFDGRYTIVSYDVSVRAAPGDAMELTAGAVDDVWDEVLTGATHNVPTSAGRRLRALSALSIIEGTAITGTVQTITLDGDASVTPSIYNENLIVIVDGTGAGQTRMIIEYSAARVATVDRAWDVVPDATSEYFLAAFSGILLSTHGSAIAGTATSITLSPTALAEANSYVGCNIYISSGTGTGQTRLITAYTVGRVATVSPAWDTNPDATSVYKVLPVGRTIVESIVPVERTTLAGVVWEYEDRTLTSFGNLVRLIWNFGRRYLTMTTEEVRDLVTGYSWRLTRGTTWMIPVVLDIDLTVLTESDDLFWTYKDNPELEGDGESIIQLSLRNRLIYFNKKQAVDPNLAYFVMVDESIGAINIYIPPSLTRQIELRKSKFFDFRLRQEGIVSTVKVGTLSVVREVTRSI